MDEHKKNSMPLSDEQLEDITGGAAGHVCGVSGESFPDFVKCCARSTSMLGTSYEERCSCCSIWSSLPDSTSLKIAYILECSLYGYVRRLKE